MTPREKIHVAVADTQLEVIAGASPPHSPECEVAVLGSILCDSTPAGWALCCSLGVKPKAFFVPANREIWNAINELRRRGVPDIDVSVVFEELKIQGKAEDIGGLPYLVRLGSFAPTSLRTRYFAEQLVLLWQLRHALDLSQELREAALEFGGRDAFTATAGDIGQRLMRLGRRAPTKTLAEEITEVQEDVTTRAEGRVDQSRWISSGLPLFDERCKPFTGTREDQLVVIGGGSGVGKSVVLRQLAGAALLQNKTVLSLSRETSTAGFVEMLIASWTEFDLLNPELNRDRLPAYRQKCSEMLERWADKLLFCVEHSASTPLLAVEDIEDQVHAFVNLRGQPNLILIDYLQLFGTRKRLGSREETVATVSHRLQALVRELPGTTMLVAVQLNETGLDEMRQIRREMNADGTEGRVIHRLPKPGDIRESQAIYHDADRMIFLYRPPIDCRNADQRSPQVLKPEVWWYQEKRRRGGIGIVRCWFEKRYTRFVQVSRNEADSADEADAAGAGLVPPGGMDKSEWKRRRGK
jgi:replicative DNA helicase